MALKYQGNKRGRDTVHLNRDKMMKCFRKGSRRGEFLETLENKTSAIDDARWHELFRWKWEYDEHITSWK